MPPKPISRLKAVAKRAMTAISMRRTMKNGGRTSGATAAAASPTPQIIGAGALTASRLRVPEETPRADDEDHGHDREQQHDGHSGEDQDPERLQLAHEQRADQGAREAPEPADYDHDEGVDEHVGVHPERHRHRRG